VSFVRDKLNQELYTYGYKTELIDVTDMVLVSHYTEYSDDKSAGSVDGLEKANRAKELQRRGNYLRERGGEDFIAKAVFSDFIYKDLKKDEGMDGRKAYIIDSLKNPAEAAFFRKVFGDAFYLIGVMADGGIRKNRLIERKNYTKDEYEEISAADEGEQQGSYGQHSIDTIVESDYFFENNFDTKDEIPKESERLLRLIFRTGIDTPRMDEDGMNMAFLASLKSACLSRQVGASIYSEKGEIIATGYNDVPKYLGGLYSAGNSIPDKRCWAHGAKCYNDNEKDKIIQDILGSFNKIFKEKCADISAELERDLFEVLSKSRVKKLLEFSRSIHAEMEAILSVARKGVKGLAGATLYCTTYPCHNCAKHIVGAGIKRLVYLEPYDKSLARQLHTDSISDASKDRVIDKLVFDSYKGVAPRRYGQFFSSSDVERKADGMFVDNDRSRTQLFPVGAQSKIEFNARLDAIYDEIDVNK